MRITITCPSCQQRSQIESQHRGRRLKCPYPACKKPFMVGDDGVARHPVEQPAVAAAPLPAAAPPILVEPQEVDWQVPVRNEPVAPMHVETMQWEAPPVRRDAGGFEPPPVQNGAQEPSWEPPPVRRAGYEEEVAPVEEYQVTVAAEEEAPADNYALYAPTKKKRSGLVMLIGVSIVFLVCAVLGVLILKGIAGAEDRAYKEVTKEIADSKWSSAHKKLEQLLERYPNSDKKATYEYYRDYTGLRDDTVGTISDVVKVSTGAKQFVKDYKGKPLFKENHDGIYEALNAIAVGMTEKAKSDASADTLKLAKEAIELAKQEGGTVRDGEKVDKNNADLDKRFAAATTAVDMAAGKAQLLATIKEVLEQKKPGSAESVNKVYDDLVKLYPKIANDPIIQSELKKIFDQEPGWVTFYAEPTPKPLPRGPVPGGSVHPSLFVGPKLKGDAAAVKDGPVVLALVQGVLYGQSQADGDVRWAMRVGIDTTTLPVRLRAGPAQPELALVLSAETNTASAVETATGKTQWHYDLKSPCSAGPVLVGRPPTAYIPTEDGKIHVIEPLGGKLLGVYETGQQLSVPGAFDPITQRLYIPAAHRRIHVLDLQAKKCAGVIYTDHAVGGLRGAPVIAPPSPGQPSVVLIAEAETLDTMKIRGFSVPDNVNETKPVAGLDGKTVEFMMPGWAWFSPYFDGDTIGIATDRGYLALFGLNRGTKDRQVFRVTTQPLPIGDQANPQLASTRPIGRAQIADVELGQWWLFVGGVLQPHRFDLYRQQLVRSPGEGLALGIPLQESQSIANGQHLVTVTQALDREEGIDRSVATCITTGTGKLNWQRQLGFVCSQEPLVLGDHVFAVDKLGGLLHVDVKKSTPQPNQQWLSSVDWLAHGAEERAMAQLLAAPDGKSVVVITFLASSERMRLQKYDLEKGIQPEQMFRLDSPPIGTAVLTETSVMVPCRDGTLREFPIAGARELPVPLTWRDPKAGIAIGHAALLSPNQLMISNGLNRLQQWNRTGNVWQKGEDGPELSTGRITTPLLILPGAENDKYLCLGDDANNLHLFSASRFTPLQVWRMDGKITKGPFVRGNRIGCVVDGERLVWLDPNQVNPLWQYPAQGAGMTAGAIVGEPTVADNMVVVAHQAGGYVWLDAETGAPKAQASVKSQAIPTTGVVPFGPGRVLSPLSDGTLMMVSGSGGG